MCWAQAQLSCVHRELPMSRHHGDHMIPADCYWSMFLSTDIYTLGGNAFGAPCVFPFKLNGKWYAKCIPRSDDAGSFWCATSSDFDKDQLFGNCPLKGNLLLKISGKALSKSFIHSHGQNLLGLWKWHWAVSWTLASLVHWWARKWSTEVSALHSHCLSNWDE